MVKIYRILLDTLEPTDPVAQSNFAHLNVPSTDPDTTEQLWTEVASVVAMSNQGNVPRSSGRRPGRGASRTDSDAGKLSPSISAPQSLFDPSESQATPESTATNATRTISPRSSKFTKQVLHPRGISINDTNSIVPSAFSHFGTSEPPPGEIRNSTLRYSYTIFVRHVLYSML